MKTPARPQQSKRRRSADPSPAAAAAPAPQDAPEFTARLLPLDPGFYAISLTAETRWREPVVGFALPAVHVCAAEDRDGVEITDASGRRGEWLGGQHNMLLVKAPQGAMALLTAYLPRDPDEKPLDVQIQRIGAGDTAHNRGPAAAGAPQSATQILRMGGPVVRRDATQPVSLEIVAHVRTRGDLRFSDNLWVGRVGQGLWIEAFTISTHDRAAAAAIEYKGLTASGAETPWIPCGAPCGTQGRSTPLLGFAIRQKALPGEAQFDCEYSGYFRSEKIAGPFRNGAPCRSPQDNDPLEGIQLRITPRPSPALRPRPE